ncbi:hypothetical protein H1R20_g13555, partial [Candolleomyces eurysporus]
MEKRDSKVAEHYTIEIQSSDNVEKGQNDDTSLKTNRTPSDPNPGVPTSAGNDEGQGDRGSGSGEQTVLEFRADARIWYLYLEDAERVAKEKAELWKTGLDSLLIFAGLFAGVVSSFLIDARPDLHDDSEQALLGNILDTLRGTSIIDMAHIPVSQKWITGLWLMSLYITLFSAIMGVLAKAWLAKFVPFTTGREAKDAHTRYKLDKGAEFWHLEGVITLVPFLVQVAALLFLGGLIIQNIADDQTLGHVLLGFGVSGCLIYAVMTILPIRYRSSPFNTPLTEVLAWLRSMLRAPPTPGRLKAISTWTQLSKFNEGLAEILYTELIKASKPTHVDEAAAEIAHPNFARKWIHHYSRTDSPSRLLECFKICASTRTSDAARRNEILCNYLLAFLRFVSVLQEKLVAIPEGSTVEDVAGGYQHLLGALQTSLKYGYPLHRWNTLPEFPRQLSFSLRTQIMCLLQALPEKDWTSQGSVPPKLGFQSNEMLDRLWELALQDIQSSHRLHFMLSACRGVLQGKESVKTTSLYILNLCLAKAGCTASETERTSEWAGSIETTNRESVEKLELQLLPRLHRATITEIENMAKNVLNDIPSLSTIQGILKILVSEIAEPKLPIDPLKMLSQIPDLKSDLFDGSIKTISDMTVFKKEGARKDGLQILTNLVASSMGKLDTVMDALRASVEIGFKSRERQERMRTIAFVRTIWKNCDSSFYSLVDDAIPALVEVALNAESTDVRQPALRLAEAMWANGSCASLVRGAVPTALNNGLDDLDPKKRYRVLTDLLEHLKDDESKVTLEKPRYAFAWEDDLSLALEIFPVVFGKIVRVAIHDGSKSVCEQAFRLLQELCKNGHVSGSLKVDALAWLEIATGPGVRRSTAVHVLEMLIDKFDLTNVDLLKTIIEWAGSDEHIDVRRSSVRLISIICKEQNLTPEMLEVVKEAILLLRDKVFSSEGDSNVRALWVQFLADTEERVSSKFPEIVPIFVELYGKTESDTELFESAHENLLLLEEDREYTEAFDSALPQDLKVSFHGPREHWSTTAKWIKLLVLLSRRAGLSKTVEEKLQLIAKEMRDEIEAKSSLGIQVEAGAADYTPKSTLTLPLRRQLHKIGPDDRRTWVDILATIAAFYPFGFKDVPNILFQMAVHDPDPGVQSECLQRLSQLSEHILLRVSRDATRALVRGTVDQFNEFVKSADKSVRISHMQLLSAFKLHYLENLELLREALNKLSNHALLDSDDDYRFEAVKTFSNLTEPDGEWDHSIHELVETMVNQHFGMGVVDKTEKVRRLWVRLAGPHIRNAEFPELTKLFDAAIKDSSLIVQSEGMSVLQQLLIHPGAEFRGTLAAKLGEALVSSLRTAEHTDRAVTVLTTVTAPPKPEKTRGSEERHQLWVQIMLLLSRNAEFQALPKLIEMVIKEQDSGAAFGSQDMVCSLFQNVKQPDAIDNILPNVIESALKLNVKRNIRLAAISLFRSVIECVPSYGEWIMALVLTRGSNSIEGESQSRYEISFLGCNSDSQIMCRLADTVIKDEDGDMRIAALQVLKVAFPLSRFRDANKVAFSKIIEMLLKERGNDKHHSNARSALDSLVRFGDIASLSISQVLRTVLMNGGQDPRNSAGRPLFDNFAAFEIAISPTTVKNRSKRWVRTTDLDEGRSRVLDLGSN